MSANGWPAKADWEVKLDTILQKQAVLLDDISAMHKVLEVIHEKANDQSVRLQKLEQALLVEGGK